MNTKHSTRETLTSEQELAQRLAELERRMDLHDEILRFLRTILDQLKESGCCLVLTDAQRAQLNRWLDGYERNPEDRLPLPEGEAALNQSPIHTH